MAKARNTAPIDKFVVFLNSRICGYNFKELVIEMYADIARLVILSLVVGLCFYSAGLKLYKTENKPIVGLRKFSPDFKRYCGEDKVDGVQDELLKKERRNACKKVVSDATEDAQTQCNEYLENEKTCRLLRGNVAACMSYTLDANGCAAMITKTAVAKAGYI